MRNATMSNRMGSKGTHWRPMPRRAPQMIDNMPRLGGAQLGLVFTAGTLIGVVARIGIPLLVGAGVVAGAGALVKTALPDVGVNTSRIPHAALLGGAGVAAYYAGSMLPTGWQPAAYIAAVAGVSASVYWLFSGKPASSGPRNETANPLPPYNIHDTIGITFDPGQPNTGRDWRSAWATQDYEFTIKNKTNEPQDFFVGLKVFHENLEKLYLTKPDPEDTVYGRKEVKLPPGGTDVITVSHKSLLNAGNHVVEVQIFRELFSDEPALTAQIPVAYTWGVGPIIW